LLFHDPVEFSVLRKAKAGREMASAAAFGCSPRRMEAAVAAHVFKIKIT
jgi:hypothetical protein